MSSSLDLPDAPRGRRITDGRLTSRVDPTVAGSHAVEPEWLRTKLGPTATEVWSLLMGYRDPDTGITRCGAADLAEKSKRGLTRKAASYGIAKLYAVGLVERLGASVYTASKGLRETTTRRVRGAYGERPDHQPCYLIPAQTWEHFQAAPAWGGKRAGAGRTPGSKNKPKKNQVGAQHTNLEMPEDINESIKLGHTEACAAAPHPEINQVGAHEPAPGDKSSWGTQEIKLGHIPDKSSWGTKAIICSSPDDQFIPAEKKGVFDKTHVSFLGAATPPAEGAIPAAGVAPLPPPAKVGLPPPAVPHPVPSPAPLPERPWTDEEIDKVLSGEIQIPRRPPLPTYTLAEHKAAGLRVPPDPLTLFPEVTLPRPPGLDPAWDQARCVEELRRAYRSCYESQARRRLFGWPAAGGCTPKWKHWDLLALAAQLMGEREIQPAPWVAWRFDLWAKNHPDRRAPPGFVFGAAGFDKAGWYEHEKARYTTVSMPRIPEKVELYSRYKLLLARLATTPPEQGQAVLDEVLPPELYERLLEATKRAGNAAKATWDARAARGEWIWPRGSPRLEGA